MRYTIALGLLAASCAGSGAAGPDLALHDLRVSEVVPVGHPITVQLKITRRRLEVADVRLDLEITTAAGQHVSSSEHEARLPGPGTHALQMTLKAPSVGEYRLIVRAPIASGEADADNNAVSAPFAVRPAEPRVLYIEHPPRFEYRFLKNALVRDSTLLVHVFLTSAEEGFPQEHSRDATDLRFKESLAALPRTVKDLLQYDVVIVGDVDAAKLPAEALRAFVEEHGRGLIVIAGTLNSPHGWGTSPLAKLLPVESLPVERDSSEIHDRPFGYRLTEAGRQDPLTRFPSLATDARRNAEQWEDADGKGDGLVGVRWFVRTRAKEHARVIVEAGPAGDSWYPFFVTARAGQGRVFFSATDETWLWRYLTGDSPWFYPFWRQVVEWAAGGE